MPAKKTTKPEAAPAKPAKAAPKAKAETKAEPKGKAAKAAPAAKGKAAKPAPAPARKPITQAELIDRLASKTGATKTHVKAVLDELAAVAAGEVAAGFTIPGIGKVGVRETAERQGRNPATGAAITIPAGKRVKFSVAAALKKAVG